MRSAQVLIGSMIEVYSRSLTLHIVVAKTTVFGDFGNVEVAKFHAAVFGEKHIGTLSCLMDQYLEVPVVNFHIVQDIHRLGDLNKHAPDLFLLEVLLLLLVD